MSSYFTRTTEVRVNCLSDRSRKLIPGAVFHPESSFLAYYYKQTAKTMSRAIKANTTKRLPAARRAQAPGTNAKTVLCRAYQQNGHCPYGTRCNYAHGTKELALRKARKFDTPCWYFNHGGCTKSAEECVYQHVIDENMRKPINLQHPCPFFHHRTPLRCRHRECRGDHQYELTAAEWKHHFPELVFPGVGYLTPKPEPVGKVQLAAETFPILDTDRPKPQSLVGAWGRPLTVKPEEPQEETPAAAPGMLVLNEDPVSWGTPRLRLCEGGPSWADDIEDEEKNPADWWSKEPEPTAEDDNKDQETAPKPTAEDDNKDQETAPEPTAEDDNKDQETAPAPEPTAEDDNKDQESTAEDDQETASSEELRNQVVKLEAEVAQLKKLLSSDASKMPQMDSELKSLVTTVLKSLLQEC